MGSLKTLASRKLTIIILFSVLGAVSNVAVGYAGRFLSFAALGPVGGQLLAGLHVFWLILVALIARSRGTATVAGVLMGTIEMILPNHMGVFVFLMALLEGAVIDLVLLPFKRAKQAAILVAAGLSSASNVFVLQAFQILPFSFPPSLYAAMYGASFLSGLVLGGYLGVRSLNALEPLICRV